MFDHAAGQDWSSFLYASAPTLEPTTASPSASVVASTASLSTPSPSSVSIPTDKGKDGERRSSNNRVANLLVLTELRQATWARIYLSGISTGDAAISTCRIPTWKRFDEVMIKRHRHIAVHPRDNRTLGWIACFNPYPLLSCFYQDPQDSDAVVGPDGRQGRTVEIQVMVAEVERNKGVGTFLVNAILSSLQGDTRFSTVQASFFPENQACQRLFEKCGFEVVGTRKNAVTMLDGPTMGTWRDLITVQVKLPPLQSQTSQHQHQQPQETSVGTSTALNMTIDPNALFKRPRLD
ncbi:uncharacterized protein MEPE_04160 [Melanopsichium pennsylvanicum]|uniref:N-acetyltransferase domain-containing protein n=2 Tax=Melanopsichium pennsylvanicum TaxID=63383 RepID=A0AAJ4XPC2_9BASI|nr:uncharacterized protein MEPE_04160 [Melanopsichium pennsylvanicum]